LSDLYVEYEVLCKNYPGWGISEIKDMPARERNHWLALIMWRKEQGG
jgi:hypothetical protein